jgi:hypothetical protein
MGTCSFEFLIPLRGIPDDFEIVEDRYHPTIIHGENKSAYHPNCILMGEWGYSWIFASEILQASAPRVTRTVVIPIDEYRQWDGISEPTPWEWASNSFGHAVGMPDKLAHLAENVTAAWDYNFTEDFSYFVDEVHRLKALHGDVRFVFGFA